jgi:hypothetical protein
VAWKIAPGRTIAIVLSSLAAGCGGWGASGTAGGHAPAASGAPSSLPSPAPVRRPVSAAKRRLMLSWMSRYRDCMAAHGTELPAPVVHARDVSIDVSAVDGYLRRPPALPSPFMRRSLACAEALGGPPATFLRTGGVLDMFVGKTCPVGTRGSGTARPTP